jgi:hypothetical protein
MKKVLAAGACGEGEYFGFAGAGQASWAAKLAHRFAP